MNKKFNKINNATYKNVTMNLIVDFKSTTNSNQKFSFPIITQKLSDIYNCFVI